MLDLIVERGITGVTTNAVAERARISKATMYRRWRSKDALVAAAISTLVDREIAIPDTGTLRGDVHELLAEAVALYSTPRAAALMPELVAGMARDSDLAGAVRNSFLAARRAAPRWIAYSNAPPAAENYAWTSITSCASTSSAESSSTAC